MIAQLEELVTAVSMKLANLEKFTTAVLTGQESTQVSTNEEEIDKSWLASVTSLFPGRFLK